MTDLGHRARPIAVGLSLVAVLALAWKTTAQIPIWRDSETLWQHALEVARENNVALNNLGAFYESRGDYEAALTQYQKALLMVDHQPLTTGNLNRASIETNMGNLKAKQGDLAGAEEEYRRALRAQPDFPSAYLNLAQVFAQQRDWSGALAEYEAALQFQPRDASTLHLAGIALMRLDRREEAIMRFRAALEVDPQFALASIDLGNVFLAAGKIDEAAFWYQKAAHADPKNADANFNLGRVYLGQRRVSDPVVAYERAVKSAPDDAEAHLGLATAYAYSGADARAVVEAEKALSLGPESVSTLNNLAWLLDSSSDTAVLNPKRAIDLAEKASGLLAEPNAVICRTLSGAYAAAGRRDDAIAAAEKCRELADANGDKKVAESATRDLEVLRKSPVPK